MKDMAAHVGRYGTMDHGVPVAATNGQPSDVPTPSDASASLIDQAIPNSENGLNGQLQRNSGRTAQVYQYVVVGFLPFTYLFGLWGTNYYYRAVHGNNWVVVMHNPWNEMKIQLSFQKSW